MSMLNVTLWANPQRVNKKTKMVSLYIRIYHQKIYYNIPLEIRWPWKYYDNKENRLLPRSKDDVEINDYLAIIEAERSKYWEAYCRLRIKNKVVSVKTLLNEVKQQVSGENFFQYMKEKSRERKRQGKIKEPTQKQQMASANWVKTYSPDVAIHEINSAWLEDYESFLSENMHPNSVWNRIKDVKSYLSLAMEDNLSVDPDYLNFQNPKPESSPTWLDKNDLERLIHHYHKMDTSGDKTYLRVFLFCCFTGLRISDAQRFNKSWIKDNEIVFEPQKQVITKTRKKVLHIPILPITRSLIDHMPSTRFASSFNQLINKRLKVIGAAAGVTKSLTTHVARHTFATMLCEEGVNPIVIKELMGHSDLKITQVYIHIVENARRREMMKLNTTFGHLFAEQTGVKQAL